MSKLPLIKAKELIKILLKLGFDLKRQKGSHKFFQHNDGRTTVIPDHGSEQLDRGLLNKIIKQDLMITYASILRDFYVTSISGYSILFPADLADFRRFNSNNLRQSALSAGN